MLSFAVSLSCIKVDYTFLRGCAKTPIIEDLKQKGVDFASVQDGFDTSTASGKMVFSVIGAMAEYERNLMRERTMAGLAAARARGRMGGRPKSLDEGQVRVAITLANEGELTIKEICEQIGCSRSTYYRQVAPRLKMLPQDLPSY